MISVEASSTPKYVVVTPVRDEAEYLPRTIESVSRQTLQPTEWVIVDDGSTDVTAAIMENAASRIPWLHCVYRANRGRRKPGGGVVETFSEGFAALRCQDWDFVVKLDGDLSFNPDYFELCLAHFNDDPTLGIGGGSIYNFINGALILERCPGFHVRGATKIYRRHCWEVLGGLVPTAGWDTLDEVKAHMTGWTTRTFPEIAVTHHRFTGTADGVWNGLVKNGRASYICGYHPLFMAARCALRLTRRPYAVGALALAYGYLRACLERAEQVHDPLLIRFVREQQIRRLTGRRTIWR